MVESERVLRELGVWDSVMKISAIASQIRCIHVDLTRDEWNKVGKALEELVSEIRLGVPTDVPGGNHFKSAMWLLGGKK